MKWKIWYSDGSTYSDSDGPPEEAPGIGVIVVAQENPEVGTEYVRTGDYYWWLGNGWTGGDIVGVLDHIATQKKWLKILLGRFIPNEEYRAIIKLAMADSHIPRKSAWMETERR